MVNTEIPKNYTISPSSVTGTPYLTINHGAAIDLDSSNSFEGKLYSMDSAMTFSDFFPIGPEKLLEVWFAPSPATLPLSANPQGLKAVPAAQWTEMLDLVRCQVLSVLESESVDAYLLSESSLFVFHHKLVLKTCGVTTLLSGLPRILEIAALSAGFPRTPANVKGCSSPAAVAHRVFYSRKNFLYPEQQRGPHRSWRDEVRALDRLFRGGSAYMIGKMNGEHWYLYITEPDNEFTPPLTPICEKSATGNFNEEFAEMPDKGLIPDAVKQDNQQDETLEILMTDLDEENAKKFYFHHASAVAAGQNSEQTNGLHNKGYAVKDINGESLEPSSGHFDVFEQTSTDHSDGSLDGLSVSDEQTVEGHILGTVVSDMSGLSDVYPKSKFPDARIDAYMFDPCGFSANGVIPSPNESKSDVKETSNSGSSYHYFTVHVTPEPQCSYASFETNVPARQTGRETAEIVEQVVNIFRPGRFSVTLFEATDVAEVSKTQKQASRMECIPGYRRIDRIVHDLDGYDLVFRHFVRHDWKGGAPRLGENC